MHAGEVIAGRFRVEAVVGSGGMGTVWRAHDLQAGQQVALKVLRDASATHLERFLREALLLEEIRHPAVCSYIAHGTLKDGAPFLAMEWLEGEDLAARLRRESLTPAQSVELVRRVAEVLATLHDRGVIHRDIKPSNLLLVGGDPARVKLLDFGVARLVNASAGSTHTGMMLGTPGYMSPEQARAERLVDGRADLFSLGCVLYECLVGEPPFVADHPIAVLAKILVEEAPRLAQLHPELGAGLDALVASLLAKDPAGRPATAQVALATIAELGSLEGLQRAPTQAARRVLTSGERSLCSVILAGRADTWAQLSSEVTAAPAVDSQAATHAAAADFRLRQAAPRLRAEVEAAGGAPSGRRGRAAGGVQRRRDGDRSSAPRGTHRVGDSAHHP